MIKDNLFTIPIWIFSITDFKKKKKELIKILKPFKEKKEGIQTFKTNRHILRKNLSENFSKILLNEIKEFSKELKKDILIEDVWSVSYEKNEYHSIHDHGSKGLSGILYLDMPKDAPETIYLQPWNDWTIDRTIYRKIPVKEGDIVIIPKFIKHFTEPNKSKKIKKVISWDMQLYDF
jgi:hypothetical protein